MASTVTPALSTRHVRELTHASLQGLTSVRQLIAQWTRSGVALEDIYLLAIAPAAADLGAQWATDDISFAQCALAVSHLQHVIHDQHEAFMAPQAEGPEVGSVLLITEPQAQHNLGVVMLGEFFQRAGWAVTLALPADMQALIDTIQSDWFDAVLLSVSTDRHLADLASAYGDCASDHANPDVLLFVGGPMAWIAPDELQWTGVVMLQQSAIQVVSSVTQAMQQQQRRPRTGQHEMLRSFF